MWQTSRFECKYMVPPHLVDAVRCWMQRFLQPDRFALTRPNYTYAINSLYLDTVDYQLYRMTGFGAKNRFKLRIRCYNDDPSSPLFFEIKRRIDRVIIKSRVTLKRDDARELVHGRLHPAEVVEGEDRHHLETFLKLMRQLPAVPAARIRYAREAYESSAIDQVRLTLDSALSFAVTPDFNYSHAEGCWHWVPMNGMLLEIKFVDYFPQWVAEMIRHFELQKIPFSKYSLSLDKMLLPSYRVQSLLEGV